MSILLEARAQIDAADNGIAKTVSQFSAAVKKVNRDSIELPEEVVALLDDHAAPHELVKTVIQFIDLKQLADNQKAFISLTTYLLQRYDAVFGVAAHKKTHPEVFADAATGRFSSYDSKRHADVVQSLTCKIVDRGGDLRMATRIAEAIPNLFVKFQDPFLNDDAGPMAVTEAARKKGRSEASGRFFQI